AAQVDLVNDIGAELPVLTKSLPAGMYVVNGSVNLQMTADDAADSFQGVCTAYDQDDNVLATGKANALADQGANPLFFGNINIPVQFAVDLTAVATPPPAIVITCATAHTAVTGAGYGVSVPLAGARLQATEVASLG
ncbi:MAG: hypothetical protein WBK99_10360, partial [Solirubrobacterales bacterium]